MSSVVVTGCGRGLGRAIARRLAGDGWAVVGLEVDAATAEAVAGELGSEHDVLTADVTDPDAHVAAAARARELAPLAGWVNNAAVTTRGDLREPNRAEVERVLRVNVDGSFWGCAAAVRAFLEQGSSGAIVNLSSIHARRAFAGWAAYETSKGAIESLTRYVAAAYGADGIRANAVAPGVVMSPGVQAYLDASPNAAEARAGLEQGPPLGRLGEPHEVAAVVAFLLSDEASYVSGQCLGVDGAWSIAGTAGED